MKHYLLLSAAALTVATMVNAQTVLIDENFDSFSVGDYAAESVDSWSTWGDAPGTAEDALISDVVAASGANSVFFESSSNNGGPTDIMVPFGYTDGSYEVSFDIYVTAGAGGYFNIQDTENAGDDWVADVFFEDGVMSILGDPGTGNIDVGMADYDGDTWHNMQVNHYHGSGVIEFRLNGTLVGSYTVGDTAPGNLGGINFFAYGGSVLGNYYIDNFKVTDNSELSVTEVGNDGLSLTLSPNPSEDILTVDLGRKASYASLEVMSMTGALVNSATLMNEQSHMFDVSSLESGFYFVRLQQNETILTKRLVIK